MVRTSLGGEPFSHVAKEEQRTLYAVTLVHDSPSLKISQGKSPRHSKPLHRYAHLEKKNRKLLFPQKQKY